MSGCCWPSCIGSTSTPESVLRFWFWLLDLCMDWHQHTSENFYIHTSSRVPRGHVIGLLAILHTRLKTKGDRALAMVTPRLWYSLPLSLRSVVVVGHTAKTSFFLFLCFSNLLWSTLNFFLKDAVQLHFTHFISFNWHVLLPPLPQYSWYS